MEVEFAEHGESDAGGDEKHDEEELEAKKAKAANNSTAIPLKMRKGRGRFMQGS